MGILQRTERSMVRAMCGEQLKVRKRAKNVMLCLNETIDKLAMVSSVCWYGPMLTREDGHILRRALGFGLKIISKRKAKEDMEKAGRGGKYDG